MREVDLGDSIARARRQAGLTQQQLCQKLGLSYSTLAKIERGAIKSPSVFTVTDIAAATGTTVEALAGRPLPQAAQSMRTSPDGIQFVFFDVHGCLVRYLDRALTDLAEDAGLTPEAIMKVFWQHAPALNRGEESIDQFNELLRQTTGLPDVDWMRYYIDSCSAIPELQEVVGSIAREYRAGLLTNIMSGQLAALRAHGMLPKTVFEVVVESCSAGMVKPEAGIYTLAEDAAGVPPQAILLVDDSQANLMAVEAMGWHVAWCDPFQPSDVAGRLCELLDL